jgi:hypothetical protein
MYDKNPEKRNPTFNRQQPGPLVTRQRDHAADKKDGACSDLGVPSRYSNPSHCVKA